MNYNEVFRVFDNGGETVDRYTVFLTNSPDEGALGLSDDPTNPQYGFSQFGDFDMNSMSAYNKEISFSDLPEDVQKHAVDRFGLEESSTPNLMEDAVLAVVSGDKEQANSKLSKLIETKIQKLMELNAGSIKFVGDDVLVGGKKVGELSIDLQDYKTGILFKLDGEERPQEFDDIKALVSFLTDKFRLSESTKLLTEATLKQKATVKALRMLSRKLNIPKPRFRSSNGRSEFIELSLKNHREEKLPNDLRKKAVVKVMNAVPLNFSDVRHGTIQPNSIVLTADQWIQLLSYYGIDIPEIMGEGYTVMPDIDRERYTDREDQGLEGPFRLRSGKVVYYDPKEGEYYDPDTDMYLTYQEYEAHNEPRSRKNHE
jgi:hypothetical protein